MSLDRIGVFVCQCHGDTKLKAAKVAELCKVLPGVVCSAEYRHLCSVPGLSDLSEALGKMSLDGMVLVTCSPCIHGPLLRRIALNAGLKEDQCEIVHLCEQCTWVHEARLLTSRMAVERIRLGLERLQRRASQLVEPTRMVKTALVVGGGIAGMQAALDIAGCGHKVVLLEKSPSLGGRMPQMSNTFTDLECPQCLVASHMAEVAAHELITVMTCSELQKVSGSIGRFRVTVQSKARKVNVSRCMGCGMCWHKCPNRRIPDQFNEGLVKRGAIHLPFPQAVPRVPIIDQANCSRFQGEKCEVCAASCPAGAIDFAQEDEEVVLEAGAIVLATGGELMKASAFAEFGYGKHRDIINGMQFERLLSATGPTAGSIRRPSDGLEPETVVFVACAGSRDKARWVPYCSRICCMYTAKQALLYKRKVPHGNAYVLYLDVRSSGREEEEFVRRTIEQERVRYIRGRVSRIYEEEGKLVVKGVDTLLGGEPMDIRADLVVLATAMKASAGSRKLAEVLHLECDSHGFFLPAQPKLNALETRRSGIYMAGACRFPCDITESVAQAGSVAAKVAKLFQG